MDLHAGGVMGRPVGGGCSSSQAHDYRIKQGECNLAVDESQGSAVQLCERAG